MTTLTHLTNIIAADVDRIVELRHDLHAHPQLCYEETYASETVQRELSAIDVPFEKGIAETGVVAWLVPDGPAGERDAVGLRADMDALPITEQTGLPYASVYEGRMHACGHDGHTATLIGAVRTLAKLRNDLPRPVKFFFQPAEEGGGGADRMVQAGALTRQIGGVAVASMFGLHGWPDLPLGQIATRTGPLMAATNTVRIAVTGPGGHAAFPHHTGDTIVAASQIITSLQSVVSRMIRPTRPAVLSITQINGGNTDNVIPDRVDMLGTLRTVDEATRQTIIERAKKITADVAGMFNCRAELSIDDGYPVTLNDDAAHAHLARCAVEMLGESNVIDLIDPVMGGEDFSFYSQRVPACFAFVGTKPAGAERAANLHTPKFDFNDAALPIAVELMCRLALA